MSFFKDVSLVGGVKDLVGFIRHSPKERFIAAILAIIIPSIIIFIFYIDSKINTAPPPGPKVIYFESWPMTRTDADILKDRWAIQCLKDAKLAERKESMKQLARMSGMDAEKIDREAMAARKARGEVEPVRPPEYKCDA